MKQTTLVVGASGATGRLLVDQLLDQNEKVKLLVRSVVNLPASWVSNDDIEIIQASVLDIQVSIMAEYLHDCHAVASCLGHSLTIKGIYGTPRKLVRDAVVLLCNAITKNNSQQKTKFLLMNTAGNRNRDLNEPISIAERLVISLLRLLLPPHPDNEQAADYLRTKIGQKNALIEWVIIRPDTLLNDDEVSPYSLHGSPTRSPIFNAGKTSRINVGHFMASLITDDNLWATWKGQMPVIYNK